MEKINTDRRSFLRNSGVALTGLVVAYYIPTPFTKAMAQGAAAKPALAAPNAFIHIAPDDSITLYINKLEMGQGVNTSMAQLIAEELECDWTKIKSLSAPVNPVFNHTYFGMQMTGGSSALNSSWEQHRKLGAAMREMLKQAAANQWQVPVGEVIAENGFVTHPKKGKLSYGALAEAAEKLPFPQEPKLKEMKDFKIIGKSMKRIDAAVKSNGQAIFGQDVRIPGMVYAVVARPPIPGAQLSAMDEKAARAVNGVVDVVKFADRVAVLGKTSHAARVGRDALNVQWVDKKNGELSTPAIMADFKKQSAASAKVAKNTGQVTAKMAQAKKIITAEYEFPFLAHAAMEPMNCTINYDGKTAELWSGHQMPTMDRDAAAKILGLPNEKVKLNTTYAGGSFGRRGSKNCDYVVEAAQLVKVAKRPLKVFWTREDDMRGGYYRPMNYHHVQIGLDDKNHFLAWDHHIVGHSVVADSMFEGMMVKDGLEGTITEGIAEPHYEFADFRCLQTRMLTPVATSWWRSVGSTHTAYVMETMIDELAEGMKQDPLKLRKELLKKSPRHIAVLNLLEKKTGWGQKKAPKGRAWGLAIHESFNSVVGQIAEVSVEKGDIKVHKIWAAVHCGHVVNPDVARTQVEGAIVYGLSAALTGEITLEKGQVVQGNFHQYPVLRMQQMPVVEVSFVESHDPPTGLGEPGLPPTAPAVANAVYKLTKKRLRVLPLSKELSKELKA